MTAGPLHGINRVRVKLLLRWVQKSARGGVSHLHTALTLTSVGWPRFKPSQARAMHAACVRLVDRKPWATAAEEAGYPNAQAACMAVRRLFAGEDGRPGLPAWGTCSVPP